MPYLAPTFLAALLVASAADGQPLYDWTTDAPQSVSSAATTGALTGPDLTASRHYSTTRASVGASVCRQRI